MGRKRGAKNAKKKTTHSRPVAPPSHKPERVDKRHVKIMRGYRV